MTTVTLQEAQASLPELVQQVGEGNQVVITRDHQPVARLVPIGTGSAAPRFGSCKGKLTINQDDDGHLADFHPYLT